MVFEKIIASIGLVGIFALALLICIQYVRAKRYKDAHKSYICMSVEDGLVPVLGKLDNTDIDIRAIGPYLRLTNSALGEED